MPSSYTTSLRLTLPATGELSGQWGSTVNTGITELLDAAVAGTASISTWGGAGVAYTLSNNSGTADEARRMFIVATGTPGEAKNVICPAVSKFYVFRNDTTGGFALTLKTPSGTGISVPAGQYKFLYCDGTNVVETFNSAGALTLSGALTVNGTTTLASNPTLSAGTANGVAYLNGSKVLTSGSALTFDGTNLGIGTSSPSTKLEVYDASTGALLTFNSNTNGSARGLLWRNAGSANNFGSITADYTSGVITYDAGLAVYAGLHVFRIGTGGEAMRTSGGNLLVGTTTDPGGLNTRLAVDHTGSDYGLTLNTATSAGPNLLQFRNSNSNGEARLVNNTGGPLTFYRNPTTEAARFTSGGDFIPIVQTAAPTLTSNQQMVFTLTSNTNLRISVRGTDGTTRVANITLA
jgi:hypothetical protein